MYVEYMKNFLPSDSRELLCVILILEILRPKTFDSYFLDMMHIDFMKNFFSPIRANYWLLDSFCLLNPKTFDYYFLDMMYVEFMKNFLLADSSELMAVRVISACSAQKRLIPTF